jgi:hypothetical protein
MQCSCSANSPFVCASAKPRAASTAPAVLLDARQSFDPDTSAGPDTGTALQSSPPLSYLWVCAPTPECPALPNGGAVAAGGSPVFSIPAALFVGAAVETVQLMADFARKFAIEEFISLFGIVLHAMSLFCCTPV